MIFRKRNGEFFIVEVKQYARNNGDNRNADKTLEQLNGYVHGFMARILCYNSRKLKENPDFVEAPKSVDGCAAAYEIEPDLRDNLIRLGLRYVEIPQEVVNEYIEERLDEHVENMQKKPRQKRSKGKQEKKERKVCQVPAVVNETFIERLRREYLDIPYVDFSNQSVNNNHNQVLLLGYEKPKNDYNPNVDGDQTFIPITAGSGNGFNRNNKSAFRTSR